MFQKTIISKYLRSQNQEELSTKWALFKTYFHHPTIQENIRNSKEEQYQEGFLRDLFVTIFGYTLNPTIGFNLTTELRNIKDTKKADGGIIIDEQVIGIIELKGTNTTDLGKVEQQAFNYKNNQVGCRYVVTSNFEKLRFYIEDTVHFQEFNLFELSQDDFNILYLLLSFENVKNNLPKKIKDESVSQEDIITKKLYQDYSVFKRELFQNLVEKNPDFNPLELFKKTQKLLDRLLFLFFGEDRGLLPPNSVRQILEQWNKLNDLDEYVPLYNRFKKYFGYLNTGFKGKNHDVFAYNGGLFKADEVLDVISVDDGILYKNTLKLSEYDFASEVDVNILGHIFENSLNEIDEIKSEIEGKPIDKSKTKRKKDGVFYTPKYITKYIVENTVGKLCEEKKTELGIVEEDYFTDKKRQQKTKLALLQKLQDFRTWLHQITIIDPACGSGAFLNEALNFLIEEHQYIDELEAKITGSSIAFTYHSDSILENNLFGVDLNEESVEIAKLSLWLRTAEPNRKLNNLNDNIKCGNSLIDDPEVAGEKAFNWEREFPQIFREKKAFHLVFTTHNSRVSKRMKTLGIKPGKAAELSLPQEIYLAKIFSKIVSDYSLEVLSWNVCKDHVHLVLVCAEDELYHQVRLMKSISSKLLNRWMNGINVPMGLDPLQNKNTSRNPDSLGVRNQDSLEARHQDALEKDALESQNASRDGEEIGSFVIDEADNLLRDLALGNSDSYIPEEHGNHLWSQKFFSVDTESWRWIEDREQGFPYEVTHLDRVMEYISGNRLKHGLERSLEMEEIISSFLKNPVEVFRERFKGGFDVVIGNPPYVRQELFKEIKPFLQENYKSYNSVADLYTYFIEKGLQLINSKGKFSFILPNKFLKATYGKEIRKVMKETSNLELIYDFDDYPVFADATTYPIIFILNKDKNYKSEFFKYSEINKRDNASDPIEILKQKEISVSFETLADEMWNFIDLKSNSIFQKLNYQSFKLDDFVREKIFYGIKTGKNEAFVIDGRKRAELIKKNKKNSERIKVLATGKEVKRNRFDFQDKYLLFTGFDDDIPNDFPDIQEELDKYKEDLIKRYDQGENYWNLRACAYYEEMQQPKIIYPRINSQGNFYFDEKGDVFLLDNNFFISTTSKSLLGILNSKLVFFYLKSICTTLQGGFYDFRRDKIATIPIKFPENELFLEKKADQMLSLNKDLQAVSERFQRTLERKFEGISLSKKLQDWYQLTYADFIKELTKQKIKLSLSDEAEWEDYFNQEKEKAVALKNTISQTDQEIDQMVYALYGLTEEEIAIVENAN